MTLVKKKSQQTATGQEKSVAKKPGFRCVFCGATFEHRPDVCPVCQAIGSFDACEIIE